MTRLKVALRALRRVAIWVMLGAIIWGLTVSLLPASVGISMADAQKALLITAVISVIGGLATVAQARRHRQGCTLFFLIIVMLVVGYVTLQAVDASDQTTRGFISLSEVIYVVPHLVLLYVIFWILHALLVKPAEPAHGRDNHHAGH